MPQQGLYFRRQRVLTALFKDRHKVKLNLTISHFFEKEEKVLSREKFQKKVNGAIKYKKKQKSFWRNTPQNLHQQYGLINIDLDSPFDRSSIPVHRDRGITHIKVKDYEENEAEQNDNNLHVPPPSNINLKPNLPDLLNLNDSKNVHPFVK